MVQPLFYQEENDSEAETNSVLFFNEKSSDIS